MVTFKKRDKCFVTDTTDEIVKCLTESFSVIEPTGHKVLVNDTSDTPLVIRGMTERKVIQVAEKQNRDYYYIDTSCIGTLNSPTRSLRSPLSLTIISLSVYFLISANVSSTHVSLSML